MISILNSENYPLILFILIILTLTLYIKSYPKNKKIKSESRIIEREYMKNIIEKQEKVLIDLKKQVDLKKKSTHDKSKSIHIKLDEPIILTDNKKESIHVKLDEPIILTDNKKESIRDKIEEQEDIIDTTRYNPYLHGRYPAGPLVPPQMRTTDPVYIRDSQVLNDKLYPPLGRTERPQFDLLMNFINNQPDLFNMHTRGPPDTFRPIGYLTPTQGQQTIDSTLILYGRSKYPNSDQGEFYVTSSSKISDIKVPLTDNNSNVRKITDVPNKVIISGNLLNGDYNYTELPKPDIGIHPYI